MSVAARQSSAELQGRYIFAYRNFRTNQVIYSFKRILLQRDLNAQLPDLGANRRPSEVRLDSWKPFWTLIFPENPAGYHQGQAAFQALRRWKSKREIAYQTPPDLTRNHTEDELQKLRERLAARGGSKKESVWNLVKRAKRKLRIKTIMDQKTTSVADLAYVLLGQQITGVKRQQHREKFLRPSELTLIWNNGHNYERNAERLVTQLKAAQIALQDIYKDHPGQIINTPPVLELRAKIKDLKARLKSVVLAANIVLRTKADYAKEQGYEVGEIPVIREDVYLQKASWKPSDQALAEPSPVENPFKGVPADVLSEETIQPRLPTFIGTGEPVPSELWAFASADQQTLMKKSRAPAVATEGIEIRWEDPLDAEYAEEWPAGVIHRPMGVTKHTANDPDMPPLITAQDWRERRRVERDVALLKQIEASSTDEAASIRKPTMVRRNEDGLVEHVYRELREELAGVTLDERKSRKSSSRPEKATTQPKASTIDAALKKHAGHLEHGKIRRPVVETIPLYDAPTATAAGM